MRVVAIVTAFTALMFALPAMAMEEAPSSTSAGEKSLNVSVNPLGFFFGVANLNVDFGIGESIAIGPTIQYAKYSSASVTVGTTTSTTEATGVGFGANFTYFIGRPSFTDSWFINPFITYQSLKNGSASQSGVMYGANIGYGWYWSSGLNLSLGLGIQNVSVDLAALGLGTVSGTLPSGKIQLGYAF